MTVSELIEKLHEMPLSATVNISDDMDWHPVTDVMYSEHANDVVLS